MNPQITQLLIGLYGASEAGRLTQAIARLIRKYPARSAAAGAARSPLPLSQRDALLITYADQVRAPGEAPLHTLADFAARYLREVVSGIHILPFCPSSSDDGFAVKDYCAVEPESGDWPDIARLGAHFDLMFDAVLNHASAQGEWFHRFLSDDPRYCNFFVTVEGEPDLSQVVRPRALPLLTTFPTTAGPRRVWTTFSADQVDLNYKNPEVLLAMIEVLLFYSQQGARFIRLDAVAFLWKEIGTKCLHLPQTHQVIQLMRAVLDEAAPHVLLITETNVPHAENVSYFGDGTNEAQLVYNFALPPLTLHSFATGNAEKLTCWAQSLALPSPGVTFFNFLASHDGIGLNPARGILSDAEIDALVGRALAHGGFVSGKHNPDGSKSPYELNVNYFDALSNPAGSEPLETQVRRFVTAHAILLSLAGVPGIYFHSLLGSRGDRAGAESSGIPRRINRQKFLRTVLEQELAMPDSRRSQVFNGLKHLLRIRQQHAAFCPGGRQQVLALDGRLFAVLRASPRDDGHILCLHNCSDARVRVRLPSTGAEVSSWQVLCSTDGGGASPGRTSAMTLEPYAAIWLQTDCPKRRNIGCLTT